MKCIKLAALALFVHTFGGSLIQVGAQNGNSGKPSALTNARAIAIADLEDKIRGGWAGKMIGVSYGAPVESRAKGRIDDGVIPAWKPERVENSLHQDDLYVGMTMSETMDILGLNATTGQYGEAVKASKYELWHANAGARRQLALGIKAPMSGNPKYNTHCNDIDWQIEADFIGMMSPGLPQESNKYNERVGRVMSYGDGLYAGMFMGGMFSAAYFENDVRKVVRAGLAVIPADSEYGRLIKDLLDWNAKYPDDWKKAWMLMEEKWDKDNSCPDETLVPENIDAKFNGGIVALALLYGGKDFGKTVELAIRGGQDSDCNAASAAGVLGVMLGYKSMPDFWKGGIPALADTKFDYTQSSFNDISKATLTRALKIVKLAGGKIGDTAIMIPLQQPKPAKLEQWNMGTPDKRVRVQDQAWKWTGDWIEQRGGKDNSELWGKYTITAGAEVVFSFTGTGVAILGNLNPDSGRADIFLDGKPAKMADGYMAERNYDDVLWHVYGLKKGPHTVRIVARNDAAQQSTGKKTHLREAVVYTAP